MKRSATAFRLLVGVGLCIGGGRATAQAVPTFPVSVLVFYDENGNGVLDSGEDVRLPNVAITAAGSLARTSSGGTATLDLAAGDQRVAIAEWSLPGYYAAPVVATVSVPRQSQILLPVTLPLGASNRPNTYMAIGDSITVGDGSRNRQGYRAMLQGDLRNHLGRAEVINEGVDATQSRTGIELVEDALARRHPAYALIHYGTNDWNTVQCKGADTPCFTVASLRAIVRLVKAQGSLPVLATIIPTNAGRDPRVPQERNDWVEQVNVLIRAMALEEGCLLADAWKGFVSAGDLPRLFADHVHPNDAGYRLMADAFFEAVTAPRPPQ